MPFVDVGMMPGTRFVSQLPSDFTCAFSRELRPSADSIWPSRLLRALALRRLPLRLLPLLSVLVTEPPRWRDVVLTKEMVVESACALSLLRRALNLLFLLLLVLLMVWTLSLLPCRRTTLLALALLAVLARVMELRRLERAAMGLELSELPCSPFSSH